MGSNQAQFAFPTANKDLILKLLDLKNSGKIADEFYARSGQYVMGDFATGWTVVLNKEDTFGSKPESLEQISLQSDFVVGETLEGAMMSSVSFWSQGQLLWRVSYEMLELNVEGDPPMLKELKERALQEGGGEAISESSLFLIPVRLFEGITGYNYESMGEPALDQNSTRHLTKL